MLIFIIKLIYFYGDDPFIYFIYTSILLIMSTEFSLYNNHQGVNNNNYMNNIIWQDEIFDRIMNTSSGWSIQRHHSGSILPHVSPHVAPIVAAPIIPHVAPAPRISPPVVDSNRIQISLVSSSSNPSSNQPFDCSICYKYTDACDRLVPTCCNRQDMCQECVTHWIDSNRNDPSCAFCRGRITCLETTSSAVHQSLSAKYSRG